MIVHRTSSEAIAGNSLSPRAELSSKSHKGSDAWLKKELVSNKWWLRAHRLPSILTQLKHPVPHPDFLMNIRVWIPDEEFKVEMDMDTKQRNRSTKAQMEMKRLKDKGQRKLLDQAKAAAAHLMETLKEKCRQRNGFDCGVFALLCLSRLAASAPNDDVHQENMPNR
ncbi:hypothetical protein AB1Y20_017157 [Prymnesium parvum]|uniref:Ubiquitin-like protease family profile domain-containing protein n=1 Tax=Prymnesium parvum TaxID=97485 RepID=A0AB34IBX5_PRYPA